MHPNFDHVRKILFVRKKKDENVRANRNISVTGGHEANLGREKKP